MVTSDRPAWESTAARKSRERREHADRIVVQQEIEEPTELEQLQDRVKKLEAVLLAVAHSALTDPALAATIREGLET